MTADSGRAQRWFESNDLDRLLRPIYETLIAHGERVEPTRGANRELRGVHLELANPRARLSRSWFRGRAFSAVAEFVWYCSGSDVVSQMEAYTKGYGDHVGGQARQRGAYGPRLFGPTGQIEPLIESLRDHPSTRKAVVQLFDRDDLQNHTKDVPCTCTLQFFVRNDTVELHVHMRSNDAYLGLTHDVFCFTMIQEYVAARLGFDVGAYVHTVGSLHLYETHIPEVEAYLHEGHLETASMQPMPHNDPKAGLEWLTATESKLREGAGLDELNAGYWSDLATVLWLQLSADGDETAYEAARARISTRYFDPYISDKQIRQVRRAQRETSL